MHIAVGITLCDRKTGAHCKITEVEEKLVFLHDTANNALHTVTRAAMTEYYEEFGPLYAVVIPGTAAYEIRLERCPFCGSTNLDPEHWMSDADVNNTGPGCDDCGATAQSVELWNMRTAVFDAVACQQAYTDHYHKTPAAVGFDEWVAIWRKATGAAS